MFGEERLSELAILELEHVCYGYDSQAPALEDVTLRVASGECLAVLGANGSGKSTLLKLLDGLYFPSAGTVRAFGQTLSERALRDEAFNAAFRRRVGLVFQDPDVQLFMPSVLEEVAFAPLQLGLLRDEVVRRVDEALDALQIAGLRERVPHRLSGGEKKRVALASVLTLRPDVWLLDEPTAGLDPRSQTWLLGFVRQQSQLGKTVVIATHDLTIVEQVATRVALLGEDHRLAAEGTPAQMLADRALLRACNLVA
jgi:cobalt/nickel transport system ATP-binding protein